MPGIRAGSYITTSPTTTGGIPASVTLPFPAGTAVGDLLIIGNVLNGIGTYTGPGYTEVTHYDNIGLAWSVQAKVMTTSDIATGSVTLGTGFDPRPNQVWFCVATNGSASILEAPDASTPGGNSGTVVTSGAVTTGDLVILFGGVVGNLSPSVSPGTILGTGTSGCSGVLGVHTPSAGVNTYSFTGFAGDPNFAIAIVLDNGAPAPLAITCGSPPGAILLSAYAHLFPAGGGTAPYTFAIITGTLPPGLTLNASTGSVTGTPTTVGYYPFTIEVTDSVAATDSVDCSITVSPGGSWVIKEITAEYIPNKGPIPGAGYYRYTVRCVDAAQTGTYLGFWGALGGGGGDITSSPAGGGGLSTDPAQPPISTVEVALSGTVIGSEPEINFIPGRGTAITVVDDNANTKVDVTVSTLIGQVLLETANYAILTADFGKLISFNDASPVTATLPASPPATPWFVAIENIGAGVLTVARAGNTIDAVAADLTLNQNQGVFLFSNGAAYYTERGMGGGGTMIDLAMIVPPEFTVSPSPTSGPHPTITIAKATESPNTVWAGPTSGSAAQPTFRALVSADLPPASSILAITKYVQNFSSVTSVAITHNFGSTAVIWQVYNAAGLKVDPQSQTVTNANTITLTFGVAFTGTCTVLGTGTRNGNTVYQTSWSAQTSVTVTHNLGTTAVLVQVLDGSGLLIDPQTTTITSSNVVTLTFGVAFTGSVTVMASPLAVVAISSYSTSWVAQTSVTVTHNLGTSDVVVQAANGAGLEVDPQSITRTSSNVVTLTFGGSFSGSVVVIG